MERPVWAWKLVSVSWMRLELGLGEISRIWRKQERENRWSRPGKHSRGVADGSDLSVLRSYGAAGLGGHHAREVENVFLWQTLGWALELQKQKQKADSLLNVHQRGKRVKKLEPSQCEDQPVSSSVWHGRAVNVGWAHRLCEAGCLSFLLCFKIMFLSSSFYLGGSTQFCMRCSWSCGFVLRSSSRAVFWVASSLLKSTRSLTSHNSFWQDLLLQENVRKQGR